MRSFAPRMRIGNVVLLGAAMLGGAMPARAQSAGPERSTLPLNVNLRTLIVTPLDEQGKPVADLTHADFGVFDDGKPQQVAIFKSLSQQGPAKTPPRTTVILFDLLNTFAGQRENSVTLIVRALQPLEAADTVFLYLLTNHGDMYPVHPLAMPSSAVANPPWTKQARPLLDQAIAQVNALRQKDYQDEGVATVATFYALDDLANTFMKIPGPKTMVWITRGAPNQVDYKYGCKDIIFPEGSQSFWAAVAATTACGARGWPNASTTRHSCNTSAGN